MEWVGIDILASRFHFLSNPLHWKTIKLPVDRKIVFEFSVNISQDGTHIIEVSFDDQNTYICSVLCYSRTAVLVLFLYVYSLFDITTNVANFEIALAICIIDIRFIYGVQWPKIWLQLVFQSETPAFEIEKQMWNFEFCSCKYCFQCNLQWIHLTWSAFKIRIPVHTIEGPRITRILGLEKNRVTRNSRKWDCSKNLYIS